MPDTQNTLVLIIEIFLKSVKSIVEFIFVDLIGGFFRAIAENSEGIFIILFVLSMIIGVPFTIIGICVRDVEDYNITVQNVHDKSILPIVYEADYYIKSDDYLTMYLENGTEMIINGRDHTIAIEAVPERENKE